jgi:hypothetical protein
MDGLWPAAVAAVPSNAHDIRANHLGQDIIDQIG